MSHIIGKEPYVQPLPASCKDVILDFDLVERAPLDFKVGPKPFCSNRQPRCLEIEVCFNYQTWNEDKTTIPQASGYDVRACICTCITVYMHIYLYLYYTYIHTYVRTYIHTYIHTYIQIRSLAPQPIMYVVFKDSDAQGWASCFHVPAGVSYFPLHSCAQELT